MNAAADRKVDQDRRISEVFARNAARLGRFIRGRVSDAGVAEDILQDVFSEFIESERRVAPIEQAGAWLFRVARNWITDWFRRKKPESRAPREGEESDLAWEDTFPSADAGPDEIYARERVLQKMVEALEELPEGQRAAFIAHEFAAGLAAHDSGRARQPTRDLYSALRWEERTGKRAEGVARGRRRAAKAAPGSTISESHFRARLSRKPTRPAQGASR